MAKRAPLVGGAKERDPTPAPAGVTLMSTDATRSGGPGSIFDGLTATEVAELTASGNKTVLYRGEFLFRHGAPQNGIYIVETGRIKVFYVGPSGRKITLAYWHPGTFVGAPDVFTNGTHTWSGVAAVNSSVLHLSGEALRRMVTTTPVLAIRIIEGLSFKGRCYSALAQMLATRSAPERLAHLLLHLSDLYGIGEETCKRIEVSFTHADFAHMIGVTRQWVTATLRRYRELGIIDVNGRHLVIYNSRLLEQIRDGTADPTGE
jgi:CRP/FNR family cyclic AMP-dependent transcriptional regulator